MKVLFFTTSYPLSENDPFPGGIFIHKLALHLQKRGIKVTVVAPHVRDVPDNYFIEGIEVIRVKYFFKKMENLSTFPGGIPGLLKRGSPLLFTLPFLMGAGTYKIFTLAEEYDLLHVHWLFNLYAAIPFKLKVKKPVLVTVHGSDFNLFEKLSPARILMRYCDAIVTVNTTQERKLKKKFPHVYHIPNGVEDNFSPLPSGITTIGGTGSFSKNKNFKTLAKALLLLRKEGIKFRAIFIGDGEEREEIERIVQPLREDIQITGYIPNREVLNMLKKLHIFVLPSFSEGRSIALLEAMATGRAIVASDIPQNREIIRDGVNGLLFDPNSPEDLKNKLKSLIENRERLIFLAKNAYTTIKEMKLSWEEAARKYAELYEKLLKGGS